MLLLLLLFCVECRCWLHQRIAGIVCLGLLSLSFVFVVLVFIVCQRCLGLFVVQFIVKAGLLFLSYRRKRMLLLSLMLCLLLLLLFCAVGGYISAQTCYAAAFSLTVSSQGVHAALFVSGEDSVAAIADAVAVGNTRVVLVLCACFLPVSSQHNNSEVLCWSMVVLLWLMMMLLLFFLMYKR